VDVAEQRLRQVRAGRLSSISQSDDVNDDVNDERLEMAELASERRRQTLLVISSGPTLVCDASTSKMDFLAAFGLTTTREADGQSV